MPTIPIALCVIGQNSMQIEYKKTDCKQLPNRPVCRKEYTMPIKGYPVDSGYMGYVEGEYMLFACESDYIDYIA